VKKIVAVFALVLLALTACRPSPGATVADATPTPAPSVTAASTPGDMPPAVELKLTQDYQAHLLALCGEDYREDFALERIWIQQYFGRYSGCEVVYMGCALVYTEEVRHVEIAGYTVVFSSGQEVYAYKDAAFYTLEQAYDGGLITADDVYAIATQRGLGIVMAAGE